MNHEWVSQESTGDTRAERRTKPFVQAFVNRRVLVEPEERQPEREGRPECRRPPAERRRERRPREPSDVQRGSEVAQDLLRVWQAPHEGEQCTEMRENLPARSTAALRNATAALVTAF